MGFDLISSKKYRKIPTWSKKILDSLPRSGQAGDGISAAILFASCGLFMLVSTLNGRTIEITGSGMGLEHKKDSEREREEEDLAYLCFNRQILLRL